MLLSFVPYRAAYVAWAGVNFAILNACVLSFLFVAGVIGASQNAQQRLRLAISVSALVTYFLFLHDLSVLVLPVLLTINEAVGQRDWLRAALASAVLSGFAVFWFARDSFLEALFTLVFFAIEVTQLWNRRDTQVSRASGG